MEEITDTIKTLQATVSKNHLDIKTFTQEIQKQILSQRKTNKTNKRYPDGKKKDGKELTIKISYDLYSTTGVIIHKLVYTIYFNSEFALLI